MSDTPEKPGENAVNAAADAAKKAEGFWVSNFGGLKTKGVTATLKDNLVSGWKVSKRDTAIKTGATALGLVVAADAVLRSEKSGADGRPESRSALGRLVELVVGLGVAGAGALHGGR